MVRQDSPHINASRTASSVGCFLHDDVGQTTSQCGKAAEHFDVYLRRGYDSTWTKHANSVWDHKDDTADYKRVEENGLTLAECQKLCDGYYECKLISYGFTFTAIDNGDGDGDTTYDPGYHGRLGDATVPSEDDGGKPPVGKTCVLEMMTTANQKLTATSVNTDSLPSWWGANPLSPSYKTWNLTVWEAYERASGVCEATTVPPTPSKSTCNPLLLMTPPPTPCFAETYNRASCKKPGVSESVTVTAPAGTFVSAAALYGPCVCICDRVRCARGGCSYAGPAANVVLPML